MTKTKQLSNPYQTLYSCRAAVVYICCLVVLVFHIEDRLTEIGVAVYLLSIMLVIYSSDVMS